MIAFRKGDRVRMTAEARETFPRSRSFTGVVIGFGSGEGLILVKRDGYKTASCFSETFWKKVN